MSKKFFKTARIVLYISGICLVIQKPAGSIPIGGVEVHYDETNEAHARVKSVECCGVSMNCQTNIKNGGKVFKSFRSGNDEQAKSGIFKIIMVDNASTTLQVQANSTPKCYIDKDGTVQIRAR